MSGLGAIAEDPSAMQNAIMGMVQGRLGELVGKSSGYIESLPIPTKLRVQALNGVQAEQEKLVKQFNIENLALEKKYSALSSPLHTRLYELVNGIGEPPTTKELEIGEAQSKKDAEPEEFEPLPLTSYTAVPSEEENPRGIPEFWLQVFKNHLTLSDLMAERDWPAISTLKDIKVEYLDGDGKLGYKLLFVFNENEWFDQEVLEKTYLYKDEIGYAGDFLYDRATGTDIKWKSDKNLTVETTVKKQRNKSTNQTRLIKKTVPVDSFFNFFDPPVPPSDKDDADSDATEEDPDLPSKLSMDYQLGEDFKDSIIPKATDYFTGKALQWDILNTEIESDDEESWDEEEGKVGSGDEEDEDEDE
ncbi:NAP-domain-containing protein [Flagelloscypha sp. PMI_526]|nr:NAP-domain-containing protein [Flagelloscypha sp. PMI_526]